jgi:hypothetical protein
VAVLRNSRSSLAWVVQGRARSKLCRRASIVFSILAVDVAATILETEYVPSKLNVVCDGLPRGVPPSELGLDESLWIHLPEIGSVIKYIRECDPRIPLITWAQVIDHMGLCHQLLTRI